MDLEEEECYFVFHSRSGRVSPAATAFLGRVTTERESVRCVHCMHTS